MKRGSQRISAAVPPPAHAATTASASAKPTPVPPCEFNLLRFISCLTVACFSAFSLLSSQPDLYQSKSSDAIIECRSLWRVGTGVFVSAILGLLPDLFALTVQSRLFQAGLVPRNVIWRVCQSMYGAAVILIFPLTILTCIMITVFSSCEESEADLLWLVVTCPLSALTGLSLMAIASFASRNAEVGRQAGMLAQLYVIAAFIVPLLAFTTSTIRNSFLSVYIFRWSRINAVLLIAVALGGVVYGIVMNALRLTGYISVDEYVPVETTEERETSAASTSSVAEVKAELQHEPNTNELKEE